MMMMNDRARDFTLEKTKKPKELSVVLVRKYGGIIDYTERLPSIYTDRYFLNRNVVEESNG